MVGDLEGTERLDKDKAILSIAVLAHRPPGQYILASKLALIRPQT